MILFADFLFLLAQTAAEGESEAAPFWANMVPFILLIAVFYFVLIRPQQVMKRKQEETISAAKTGDKVTTNGGIIGTVTNVRENTFLVRIAPNVKIEILKSAIAQVEKAAEGKEEPEEDDSTDEETEDSPEESISGTEERKPVPRNRSKKRRR